MSLGFEAIRSGALGYSGGKEPYSKNNSSQFYEELRAQQSALSRRGEAGYSGPSLNKFLSASSFGLQSQSPSLGRAANPQPAIQQNADASAQNSLDFSENISTQPGVKSVALAFDENASLGASGSGELGIFLGNGKHQMFTGHNLFYHRTAVGFKGQVPDSRANYELKAYHDYDRHDTGVIAKFSISF